MLFKRGNIWWMELDGKRESTKQHDEAAARRIYAARKAELTFGIEVKTGTVRTVRMAMDRYLSEHANKRTHKEDRSKAEWWGARIGNKPLKMVTASMLRDAVEEKRVKEGASNATLNRYLAFIRTVLRCCEIDWDWLESSPKVRMYTEDNRREAYLTKEQIGDLTAVLPDHLKDAVLFSLATGLRQSNVTGLKWEWINMSKQLLTVPSTHYKSKRVHTIPLSDKAMEILVRRLGEHPEYVFTYKGDRIRYINNHGWKTALKKAGLQGFRRHDLRHTFASHHAMAGTPLQALQELGGWRSAAIIQRYAHLSRDHLRQYGSNSPV